MSDGSDVKVILTNNNLRASHRNTAIQIVESIKAILELYRQRGEFKVTLAQQVPMRGQDQFHVRCIDRTFNRITLKLKPGGNDTSWEVYLIYPSGINSGELLANLGEFEKSHNRKLPTLRKLMKVTRNATSVKIRPLAGGLGSSKPSEPLFTPPAKESQPRTFEPVAKAAPPRLEPPKPEPNVAVYSTLVSSNGNGHDQAPVRPPLAGDEYEAVMKQAEELGIPTPVPIGMGLYSRVMEVSPELANEWLTHYNLRNRTPSMVSIGKYTGDMMAGQWELHHQGIGFSSVPSILDGQQRLLSIVQSNQPLFVMVTMNIRPEAQMCVDQQRTRNMGDISKLADLDIGTAGAALIRRAVNGLENKNSLSNQGVIAAHKVYEDAYNWVKDTFGSASGRKGIGSSGCRGAVLRAYYHVDLRRLAEFVDVLATGMAKRGDADTAAVSLLLFLSRVKIGPGTSVEIYAKTIRALIGFMKGERLTQVREISEDIWPLPADPASHFANRKPGLVLPGSSFFDSAT